MSPTPPADSFYQVIALPLTDITASLATLHHDNKEIQNLTIQNASGTLDASVTKLVIDTADNKATTCCHLQIHLGKGKFHYRHQDQTISFIIKDWILVWVVDFGMDRLKGSSITDKFRSRLSRPGDYSTAQLLILLTLPNLGVFDIHASKLDPSVKGESSAALASLLAEYVVGLKKESDLLFGFVPPTDNEISVSESLTDIQVLFSPVQNGKQVYNTLYYVEVPKLAPPEANDPTNSIINRALRIRSSPNLLSAFHLSISGQGSMTVDCGNVFDQYICAQSACVIEEVVKMLNSNFYMAEFNGEDAPTSSDWFLPGSRPGVGFHVVTELNPKSQFDFSWHEESGSPEASDWTRTANASVTLKVLPTKQILCYAKAAAARIEGSTSSRIIAFDFLVELYVQKISNEGIVEFGIRTISYHVDGSVDVPGPLGVRTCHLGNTTSAVQNRMNAMLPYQIETLIGTWKNSLNIHHQLVLPGASVLNMKEPTFNEQGDLIIKISRKNT